MKMTPEVSVWRTAQALLGLRMERPLRGGQKGAKKTQKEGEARTEWKLVEQTI